MPSEDILQKLEGYELELELKAYKKAFASLFKKGKYAEAYNLTIAMAVKERGSTIDAQSIQRGLDMLSKAIVEGKEAVIKVFEVEFYSGLDDSDATATANAMVTSLESSQSKALAIGLTIVGIGILALFRPK